MRRIISLFFTVASLAINGQEVDYDSIYFLKNCIVLDARESIDEEREDLIYKWQFGDGEVDGGETVEHCYDSLGTYQVVLSIIDPSIVSQFQDEWIFEITISEDYLIGFDIDHSDKTISCKSKLTHDSNPDDMEFFWDYGDLQFGIGDEVSHRYDSAGNYPIRLLAMVTEGDETIELSASQTIKIQ